jgi:hypothetical protein
MGKVYVKILNRIFGKKKLSEEKLNSIASRGVSTIGIYSWQSVYDAYIETGLTPEEAKKATDERVWILD